MARITVVAEFTFDVPDTLANKPYNLLLAEGDRLLYNALDMERDEPVWDVRDVEVYKDDE